MTQGLNFCYVIYSKTKDVTPYHIAIYLTPIINFFIAQILGELAHIIAVCFYGILGSAFFPQRLQRQGNAGALICVRFACQ